MDFKPLPGFEDFWRGKAPAPTGAGLAFVCNPNNPTATVHSISAIADFVKKVRATSPGTAIHIDEAYLDYAADPNGTAAPLALEYPDVFITRTFSKAYGMAGLRLGYAFGQPATLKKLSTAWGLGSVNVRIPPLFVTGSARPRPTARTVRNSRGSSIVMSRSSTGGKYAVS